MLTAPQLAWTAAGCPRPNEKYKLSPHAGICSPCGTTIDGDAVTISEIDSKAFSNHSESFRFGGTHTCLGCAWMYGMGKGKPGNYIALPGRFEQAVISLESVVEDKRPWLTIIREIAVLPPDTPINAVLTTDVKIRLWPRSRVTTVGRFGLYVNCPDYDVSQHVDCELADLLRMHGGSSQEAARLVLVEGLAPSEAARQAGITPQAASNALASCRRGLELARRVVTA